jgi:hypothetical protein
MKILAFCRFLKKSQEYKKMDKDFDDVALVQQY